MSKADNQPVPTVDPDDDSVDRFVVRLYAYDPARRQRRHQVVVAYDNEREFLEALETLSAALKATRGAGHGVDPQRHYTGVRWEPGHRARQRDAHLLKSAIRHGVVTDRLLDHLQLPAGVGLIQISCDSDRA